MRDAVGHRSYRTPPIVEALVEVQFGATDEWDLTIPGKLHEHPSIKTAYPGKPRQQKAVRATIRPVAGQSTDVTVQDSVARILLVSADEKRLLSLGQDALSVNTLAPYEGWTMFRPRVEAAIKAYADVTGAREIRRVEVRYINRIEVADTDVDLADLFNCGSMFPVAIPSELRAFFQRTEHIYDDGTRLLLTFASVVAGSGASGVLLDLDLAHDAVQPIYFDQVMSTIDDLHDREKKAFEAVITDRTRKLFDAN